MPLEVTWWGHATATVRDSGVTVLTDPLLVRRMAHLRRRRGALPPPDAAEADIVLISHLHADHLHLGSLSRVPRGTRVVVPRGAPAAVGGLRRLGGRLDLVEISAGEQVAAGRAAHPCRAGAARRAAVALRTPAGARARLRRRGRVPHLLRR